MVGFSNNLKGANPE